MEKEFLKFYGQDGEEIKLEKTKFEVCPRCHGEGSHTNPNIDGHGLRSSDFAEDPDFYNNYMSGVYDVSCSECNGKRVVKVVVWDKIDKETQKAYHQHCEDEYNYRSECEAERRVGA